MKKRIYTYLLSVKIILALLFLTTSSLFAQDNYIYFTPTSDTVEIESIKVENLRTNDTLNLEPNATLHIVSAMNLKFMALEPKKFKVYPNPSESNFNISYFAENSGTVNFTIFNISGAVVYKNSFYNKKAYHQLELNATLSGIYFIQISGDTFSYYIKVIGTANETSINGIKHTNSIDIENENVENEESNLHLKQSLENTLAYTFGDVLLFTFTSNAGDITKKTLVINQGDYNEGEYIDLEVSFYRCVDIEGKHYPVIVIANRIWMAENLNTKYFLNNKEISTITDNTEWRQTIKPAYSIYGNNANNSGIYGKLYNWYAVNNEASMCPEGWHLPSDDDWKIIENLIEVQSIDSIGWRTSNSACYLKSATEGIWDLPSKKLVNSTGFTAMPGGMRALTGEFHYIDDYAAWWTSSEYNDKHAWCRALDNSTCNIFRENGSKSLGLSVRCVYDKKAKEELPTLGTVHADYYSENGNSAYLFVEIINQGLSPITEGGFMLSKQPNFDDTNCDIYYAEEIFEHEIMLFIDSIESNQTFYVKAFAKNSYGTGYSEEITFSTIPGNPTLGSIEAFYNESNNSVDFYVEIINQGASSIYEGGFMLGTTPNFDESNCEIYYAQEILENEIRFYLDNIESNQTFYVKAYARNYHGTGYSEEISFSTNNTYPILGTIDAIFNESDSSANFYAEIINQGASSIYEAGFMLGSTPNFDDSNCEIHYAQAPFENGIMFFLDTIEPNQNFYIKAFARNDNGTGYSEEIPFSTNITHPVLGTIEATFNESDSSANFFAEIISHGESSISEGGFMIGTTPNFDDSNCEIYYTQGPFENEIMFFLDAIEPNQNFYIKAFARNDNGTGYSEEISFSTATTPEPIIEPTIEISSIDSVYMTSARILGFVESDEELYNLGIAWDKIPNFTIGESGIHYLPSNFTQSDFSYVINNLEPNKTYYVKTFAQNSGGQSVTNEQTFTTLPKYYTSESTVIDIDNNVYRTVRIANTEYMTENLRTSRLNDGTLIPLVDQNWESSPSMKCCYMDFDSVNNHLKNGKLYDRFAAQNEYICPTGWKVPEENDWLEFEMLLGMSETETLNTGWRGTNQGGMLKQVELDNWIAPNNGATNQTKYSAQGSGYIDESGQFLGKGEIFSTWVNAESSMFVRTLSNDEQRIYRDEYSTPSSNTSGYSIRCVRTNIGIPTVTTITPNNISISTADVSGEILNAGESPITEKGVLWGTWNGITLESCSGSISAGSGNEWFSITIPDLNSGQNYYARAYATNNNGTGYGEAIEFQTLNKLYIEGPGVVDWDGNFYKTVIINQREWMTENLRVSKKDVSTDTTPMLINLQHAQTQEDWITFSHEEKKPCYCSYENSTPEPDSIYGYLYNFDAIRNNSGTDGGTGICPKGWEIPSDDDWISLEMFLGMTDAEALNQGWRGTDEGGMLKEAGTEHWQAPNTGATNISGLNFRPAGIRRESPHTSLNFTFEEKGGSLNIWTSTEDIGGGETSAAFARRLFSDYSQIDRFLLDASYGMSARCIKQSGKSTVILQSADYDEVSYAISLQAEVVLEGYFEIVEKGFVWSYSSTPSVEYNDGVYDYGEMGGGSFNHSFGADPNQTYHIRAYLRLADSTYEYSNEIIVNTY
ncbi:MAG TPA: FISUMP domain-containing protein [Bacteroidales bacterium]|nr:FISUMP domain-containing protein [Bacteroidales bacterium]HQB21221.1 FISUMP domain-containing protein [Bacteroidales bacterium]